METEQTSLFDTQIQTEPKPEPSSDNFAAEKNAYALMRDQLMQVLTDWSLSASCITAVSNKDTFVVKFNERVLWRMRFKPKVHYIAIRKQFASDLPEDTEHSKPSQGFIRLPAEKPQDIMLYADLLLKITEQTILSFPTDFDCCHLYEACSDADHCIGSSPATCGYNRVLRSGKIYYGKNRNIDEMGNIRSDK